MTKLNSTYSLSDIQKMVANGNWEFANQRAEDNYESYGWDEEKMIRFISCLQPEKRPKGDFCKIFKAQDIYGGIRTVDMDAYKMRFDEEKLIRGNHLDCCYFVKLAIIEDEDEIYVGITSFHLDN